MRFLILDTFSIYRVDNGLIKIITEKYRGVYAIKMENFYKQIDKNCN